MKVATRITVATAIVVAIASISCGDSAIRRASQFSSRRLVFFERRPRCGDRSRLI